MACSICREKGHTKPRCPQIKKQKEEREKFVTETAVLALPELLANPLIIAFLWYVFSTTYKPANSVNKVIIGAELVPTLDLGLPPGVVLGAMMQETDDLIEIWNKSKRLLDRLDFEDVPALVKGGILGAGLPGPPFEDEKPPGITGAETGAQLAVEFQKFILIMGGVITGFLRA